MQNSDTVTVTGIVDYFILYLSTAFEWSGYNAGD